MDSPILPGSTIGIFGSGQLGRMLALAAKRMGYRIHTYSPEQDSPTGQVADGEVTAAYGDGEAVDAFVRNVDVVTFEFENVDAAVAERAEAAGVPVHPGGWVLRTAQNRIREKNTLQEAGLPVTPFVPVRTRDDLAAAASQLGFPIVLKTATSGYDGKGQAIVADRKELESAWESMKRRTAVAEKHISFVKEISVVAARSANGEYADFGAIENIHRNHILDLSIAPARVSAHVAQSACDLAHKLMHRLDVVGVTCVEYFVTVEDTLLINEIAPRPHNSGHLTIEAAITSQFEQHVRAICGLPLGETALPRPAAMANLLGELWAGGTPDWRLALKYPDAKLHLYGKHEARPGRKMGHLTVVSGSRSGRLSHGDESPVDTVLAARQALAEGPTIGDAVPTEELQ